MALTIALVNNAPPLSCLSCPIAPEGGVDGVTGSKLGSKPGLLIVHKWHPCLKLQLMAYSILKRQIDCIA